VIAVFPAVAWVMRVLTARLHTLTKANQDATDSLAYVVEENVLAHRDIRLYAAQASQAQRFDRLGDSLRHLAMKSTVAGAAMTPMTQMLAAMALSAVISVALVQSATRGHIGGRVCRICHRHADDHRAHSPTVRGLQPHYPGAGRTGAWAWR
jgi:subfamily B ATP-binding cassette protein MsbA